MMCLLIVEHYVSCGTKMIRLLVFEETNIKIYWCAKGDIDRCEAAVDITFQNTDQELDRKRNKYIYSEKRRDAQQSLA